MKKSRKQVEYGSEYLAMNSGIRTNVAKAFAGIFIRLCNICKLVITIVPILILLYLAGYIFFKENVLALIETIKNAFNAF